MLRFLEEKLAPTVDAALEIEGLDRRPVLVLDNHTVHHSKDVRDWCREHSIDMLHTPSYCSELNPVEQMWSVFKRKWSQEMTRRLLRPEEFRMRCLSQEAIKDLILEVLAPLASGYKVLSAGRLHHLVALAERLGRV